jgi:hypothetical protein
MLNDIEELKAIKKEYEMFKEQIDNKDYLTEFNQIEINEIKDMIGILGSDK